MTIPNTKPTFVVLVIDKASERDEAAEILMQDGYRVIAVPTAEQAVAVIHARWETQLVVTDVQLPGPMGGYALARLLDIKWPGMGVVVVGTREPRPEDLPPRAHFLLRPYSRSSLVQTVRELLGEPLAL